MVVVLSAMLLATTSIVPVPSPPPPSPRLSDLQWLEGTWRGRIGSREFEARYTGAEGGQILSASKYSEKNQPAGFEFERFEQRGDSIVLTPYPDGKASVSFPLADYDPKARRAVFENLAHDFPTRIRYQRTAPDRLTIIVSGPGEDGKEQVLTYDLSRRR
jgi:Domain of unknown function (DUF6265)